jgi:hypothetical protein
LDIGDTELLNAGELGLLWDQCKVCGIHDDPEDVK